MGKGNRSRQDRALETVSVAAEATPKSTKVKTTIAVIAVSFILVSCILLSLIVNTGIILRSTNAAKTDNYSVNGSIMSYLVYQQAQNMVYTFQQYGMSYTIPQLLNEKQGDGTYLDYFAQNAFTQLKQMLVLCEYADANGITLSEEDKADIDAYLDSIAETAANNFYSTNAYIKLMYGNAVSASDVRKAMELSALSSAAYEHLEEKLEGEITDEKINKYVEDNVQLFYTVDYLTYTFKAELKPAGTTATEDEKKAYEEDKKEMLALAEKLQAADTVEKFKETVRDYLVNTVAAESFDTTYEKDHKTTIEKGDNAPTEEKLLADKAALLIKLNDYLKSLDSEDEEDEKEESKEETTTKNDYEKALDKIYDALVKEAEKSYTAIEEDEHPHYDPETEESKISELDKWLFNKDTKANTTKLIKNEAEKTSTYEVALLKETSHIDESKTQDVSHLLVSFDDYKSGSTITDAEKAKAKAKAEELLAEFLKGEKTQEAFEKFAEKHTADSGVTYENVKEDEMVPAFNDWIFDETRKNADTGIVETEYGYHIMFYIGEGKTAWKADAHTGVLNELFEKWIDDEAVKCNFTTNESVINSIN